MRTAWSVALACLAIVALVVSLQAKEEKEAKEVTLKGKLLCGKCTLKETDECTNVLQVTKNGKKINYFLKDDGKSEKYHKGIVPPGKKKDYTITGTVEEKDGKKWLTVTKIKEGS